MIERIPFWKMQAIGNDFPIVHIEDVLRLGLAYDKLTVQICDRRFGVGGDGLLAMGMEGDRVRLRMFNPDGTEDFCGNGLRCAALHAYRQKWVGEGFEILHLDRMVPTRIDGNTIMNEIGVASYLPADVPHLADGEIFRLPVDGIGSSVSSLTTGSTHTIVHVDSLPTEPSLDVLGTKIEHHPLFPERTTVIWTEVAAPMHLRIRIWERGVGETLGCGTGSSAAAIDYLRAEGKGGRVQVDNRGGTVWVEADDWTSTIRLFGHAHEVFSGSFLLR